MNCDICRRSYGADLVFNCVGCARGLIYPARLDSAALLLEKEHLVKRVEQITQPRRESETARQGPAEDLDHGHLSWRTSVRGISAANAGALTQDAQSVCESLREDVLQLREDVVKKRAMLKQRKAMMREITRQIPERRQRHTGKLKETMEKGSRTFESLHRKDMDAKSSLCREAALLMRLENRKRTRRGLVEDTYWISGLPIFDLRNIAVLRCAEVSAVLSSIVQLLSIATFYLSVRLPAEITLGTHDAPMPTISTPGSSYLYERSSKLLTSTVESHHGATQSRSYSRPRPLSVNTDDIEMPVARWAKKDSGSFNFLLEGISLLAWDIAWLCRTQGFLSGTETWEDVCNVGRNLYQLLLSPVQSSAIMRVLSSRDARDRQRAGSSPAKIAEHVPKAEQHVGDWSHSSTYSFLGSANAQEVIRTWKLANHTMVVDSVRRTLWAEMSNAEWELLQEPEWDDGGEQFDEAVFVRSRNVNGFEYADSRSIMTAQSDVRQMAEETSKPRGTSGWTKVKSRENS